MKSFPSTEAIDLHLRPRDRLLKLEWSRLFYRLRSELETAFIYEQELLIDLRPFSIISADALVIVLALLQYRNSSLGARTGLALPDDRDALAYLGDLGFLQLAQNLSVPIVNIHPAFLSPAPTSHRHRTQLFSLQPLSASRLNPLAQSIKDVLVSELDRRNVSIPAGSEQQFQLFEFRNLLFEIVHNTIKHAPESFRLNPQATVGYACYRPWPRTWPKIRFTCSDLGDGFRKTLLRQKERTRDDLAAIHLALLFRFLHPDEKVISLFDALSFLYALRGRLWVASGSATVQISLTNDENRRKFQRFLKKPSLDSLVSLSQTTKGRDRIPGVHYCIDLTLPTEVSDS
jgi:hypothetical protein